MSRKFLTSIDLNGNQLLNVVLQVLASDPSGLGAGDEGRLWYRSDLDVVRYWNGSAAVTVGAGSGDVVGPASATDNQVVLFNSTTGKLVKAATTSGIIKLASGVIGTASAGTDYLAPTGNGSGLTGITESQVTNLTTDLAAKAPLASPTFTGTVTVPTPSSGTDATNKTYVDGLLAANDAMVFKGGIDASANPNYPAANAGDTYRITVAGKIGGASGPLVTAGDTIIAAADSLSAGNHATVGGSWIILQANTDEATVSTLGLIILASQAQTEARTVSNRAVTPASLATFPRKYATTITGDGSTTAFTVTHNLGSQDVNVGVRDAASNRERVECTDRAPTTNTVTVTFDVAPVNTLVYNVTVIG